MKTGLSKQLLSAITASALLLLAFVAFSTLQAPAAQASTGFVDGTFTNGAGGSVAITLTVPTAPVIWNGNGTGGASSWYSSSVDVNFWGDFALVAPDVYTVTLDYGDDSVVGGFSEYRFDYTLAWDSPIVQSIYYVRTQLGGDITAVPPFYTVISDTNGQAVEVTRTGIISVEARLWQRGTAYGEQIAIQNVDANGNLTSGPISDTKTFLVKPALGLTSSLTEALVGQELTFTAKVTPAVLNNAPADDLGLWDATQANLPQAQIVATSAKTQPITDTASWTSFIYNDTGAYTVTANLTSTKASIKAANGNNELLNTVSITNVKVTAPAITLAADKTSGTAPLSVVLTATSADHAKVSKSLTSTVTINVSGEVSPTATYNLVGGQTTVPTTTVSLVNTTPVSKTYWITAELKVQNVTSTSSISVVVNPIPKPAKIVLSASPSTSIIITNTAAATSTITAKLQNADGSAWEPATGGSATVIFSTDKGTLSPTSVNVGTGKGGVAETVVSSNIPLTATVQADVADGATGAISATTSVGFLYQFPEEAPSVTIVNTPGTSPTITTHDFPGVGTAEIPSNLLGDDYAGEFTVKIYAVDIDETTVQSPTLILGQGFVVEIYNQKGELLSAGTPFSAPIVIKYTVTKTDPTNGETLFITTAFTTIFVDGKWVVVPSTVGGVTAAANTLAATSGVVTSDLSASGLYAKLGFATAPIYLPLITN